jgi:hypothetical protein
VKRQRCRGCQEGTHSGVHPTSQPIHASRMRPHTGPDALRRL